MFETIYHSTALLVFTQMSSGSVQTDGIREVGEVEIEIETSLVVVVVGVLFITLFDV
jgi:hypothetical protein